MAKKKTLIIIESPTKTQILKNYLGDNYDVVSCNGHIVNLKKTGKYKLGIDLETFTPSYQILKEKKVLIQELQKKINHSDKTILATDPDREGEAIAYHLKANLEYKQPPGRVRFHEITESAIKKAFNNIETIDQDLVNAQETRRMLDRIIGFRLSRLLQTKIHARSAGRVQSVCLKLIVEREQARRAFTPQESWTVEGTWKEYLLVLDKYKNKKLKNVNLVMIKKWQPVLAQGNYEVNQMTEKQQQEKPPKPFRTATLMQAAVTNLGFSLAKTSLIAQQLYEGVQTDQGIKSLITYPRTDSTRIASTFIKQAQEFIKKQYGSEYCAQKLRLALQGKNIQNAHEAIRITYLNLAPKSIKTNLTRDQFRLYELIYERTISALMKPALWTLEKIILKKDDFIFYINWRVNSFWGWLICLHNKPKVTKSLINELEIGFKINPATLEAIQHFSRPPARFSEAAMVKKLEELGIGRPSTYSLIINTLVKRGYVKIENKALIPQELGFFTNQALQNWFHDFINEQYTSNLESKLDAIAEGQDDKKIVLQNFWSEFDKQYKKTLAEMPEKPVQKLGKACPRCTSDLVYRFGRFGKFIGCSAFPKCMYIESINPESFGRCPECKVGLLVKKQSAKRNQPFLGCSLYNETDCKYVEQIKKQKPQQQNAEKTKNQRINLLQ